MAERKLPVVKGTSNHWPKTPLCPICGKNKVFEPHSMAILTAGAMLMGGKSEVANIEPTDIAVHQGILSQIHEQTRNLAEGTKIGKIVVDGRMPQ